MILSLDRSLLLFRRHTKHQLKLRIIEREVAVKDDKGKEWEVYRVRSDAERLFASARWQIRPPREGKKMGWELC